MKIVSFIFIFSFITSGSSASGSSASGSSADVLPNIGYLLRGYHLYHGNPLATQVTSDPGFLSLIFEPTYNDHQLSADRKYRVPDGSMAYAKEGCTQAFTHETIQSAGEYQRLLKDMVKTNYTGFSNSFKGSSDYQSIESAHSKDHSKELLMTQIVCVKYEACLDTVKPPPYSSLFVNTVRKIMATYQRNSSDTETINNEIHQFLNTYGTHFVRKIELGSRLNFQNSLSSLDRYNLEQAGIDARTGAVLSMTKKMGHVMTQEELRHSNLFDKLISHSKASSSAPHQDDGTMDVRNSVPIPLYYEIERIDSMFVKAIMKTAGVDYKKMKILLGNYFENYCANEIRYSGQERCPSDKAADDASALAISSKNFKVVFPESGEGSSTNSILWKKKLPELTSLTISWWMKAPPYTAATNKRRHILSYNCNEIDHLKILAAAETQGGCLTLLIDGEQVVGGSNCLIPFDNNYHHYVVTWSSTYGRWQIYIDGNVMDGGSSNRGFIIPRDGYFVIGQQHETGTVFDDPRTAFEGEIAYLNVWDFTVNGVEARNLAMANGEVQGNIVSWEQAKLKFNGEGLDVWAVSSNDEFFKV